MQIETQEKNGITIFYLKEGIDFFKAPQIEQYIMQAIEEKGLKKVLLNLKDVTYMDSMGLGTLLGIITKKRTQAKIRMCHIENTILHVIKFSGFLALLQIDDSEEISIQKLLSEDDED